MLVPYILRTKERKERKKLATQGRDPSPLFGAPKACSSWEQERPRFAREGGQGRRRGTKRGLCISCMASLRVTGERKI
jgi:hypothetical protein